MRWGIVGEARVGDMEVLYHSHLEGKIMLSMAEAGGSTKRTIRYWVGNTGGEWLFDLLQVRLRGRTSVRGEITH